MHVNYCCSLYKEQYDAGLYFLHEHPLGANSWRLRGSKRLLGLPGVRRHSGDQCQYGAKVRKGKLKGSPIRKPSGFMTNAPWLGAELSRRCRGPDPRRCTTSGKAWHAPCNGCVAKQAATFPRGLCRAIIRGAEKQLKADLQKTASMGRAVAGATSARGRASTWAGSPARARLVGAARNHKKQEKGSGPQEKDLPAWVEPCPTRREEVGTPASAGSATQQRKWPAGSLRALGRVVACSLWANSDAKEPPVVGPGASGPSDVWVKRALQDTRGAPSAGTGYT